MTTHDPFRGYDQWKTASPYDNEPDETPPNMETDPYGRLAFTIGTDDDFYCFDYAVDYEYGIVKLHAVINCETASFIQDAEEPAIYPLNQTAIDAAQSLVDQAVDWCSDITEWECSQDDCQAFVRAIEKHVKSAP